jgi:ADP-ribose pyrophosphatase YjhB (NUDIX family)
MDQDTNKIIDEKYLNGIRSDRYRPCVIGAIVLGGKIVLFKSKKYPGYNFVQGGIENGETPLEALEREVMEELGYWFYKGCQFPPVKAEFLFDRRMTSKNVKSKITSASGETVKPVGKHYLVFFVDISRGQEPPHIREDDYNFSGSTVCFTENKWSNYEEAIKFVSKIDNEIKRDLARETLDLLHKKGYLI